MSDTTTSQYAPSFTVGHQPVLLDPKTARAVRVLCWTVTIILWGGFLLGVIILAAVAAEVT